MDDFENEERDYGEPKMVECCLCGESFLPIFGGEEFCDTCVEDLYGKECDD